MRARALPAALAALATLVVPGMARTAAAQIVIGEGDTSRYENLYGKAVEVSLDDLAQQPESYLDKAVRTHGQLEISMDVGQRGYLLRGFMHRIRVAPVREVASEFESQAMQLLGRDLEVTGVFVQAQSSQSAQTGGPMYGIQFWGYTGPPEKEPKGDIKAPEIRLEKLVTTPGTRDGQMIRVVGKFRGRNLYGDLPVATQRTTADWVIKDDLYAVWVTGRKPKGSGWELDSGLKRDTGKWVEVIGKPETIRGVTYIKALRVALTSPPSAHADVAPPPPPPEKPKKPPVVVFALPLDGDGEVPSDSRFVVQFSKDMDETTFTGHVLLRYSGPVLPGDRGFDGVKLTYDRGRRALTVDPGDVLRSRRQIELLLLPGIVDIDGLTLVPRGAVRGAGNAVDVLRYRVGS